MMMLIMNIFNGGLIYMVDENLISIDRSKLITELREIHSIYKLVLMNENIQIDLDELKKLIKNYAKSSTMGYLECLALFRIDIYKGKSYKETFNKFLYNK